MRFYNKYIKKQRKERCWYPSHLSTAKSEPPRTPHSPVGFYFRRPPTAAVLGHSNFSLGAAFRNFGIIQEYNERKNKKLINNVLCTDEQKFWVTSSRPSNFGDPIDTKTKVDNWFDENRYLLAPSSL